MSVKCLNMGDETSIIRGNDKGLPQLALKKNGQIKYYMSDRPEVGEHFK